MITDDDNDDADDNENVDNDSNNSNECRYFLEDLDGPTTVYKYAF